MRAHVLLVGGLAVATCCLAWAGPPGGGAGFHGGGHVAASGAFQVSPPTGHPIPGPGMNPMPYPPAGIGYWSASGYHGPARPGGFGGYRDSFGHGGRFDHRPFRYSYIFAPYYYPFFDYSDAGYDSPPPNAPVDPVVQNMEVERNQLAEQIQALTAAVDDLKSSQRQQPVSPYAPEQSRPETAEPETVSVGAPITLVLRSGQQLQIRNYAVMDGVFWDFSRQSARKIPVSTIDLDASAKATQANGGDFPQLTPTNSGGE